ncbi:putative toxin [Paenarthrobacter nicotinovorans]|nr:putative toxin [Paenarthrobacter nicotinovorans]
MTSVVVRGLRRAYVFAFVAAALAVALVAGLLSTAVTARADDLPLVVPAPVARATDDAGVLRLWKTGGPTVREAAEAALLGGPDAMKKFRDVASGETYAPQDVALRQDLRLTVVRLSMIGGEHVRAGASKALSEGDAAMNTFVTQGWRAAWVGDNRTQVTFLLDSGTPHVRSSASKMLDHGTEQNIQDFLLTGKVKAQELDNRIATYRLIDSGSKSVKLAAQAALDTGSPQLIEDFLRYGQFVAAARDIETASIQQLVDQAKAASDIARGEKLKAQESSKQAVAASLAAKQALEKAKAEAAQGQRNAEKATSAAKRAASLADQAANAADIAVSAAQEARQAMLAAANAASNAAAATSRANIAASNALVAASSAASNAGMASAARTAAEVARDAAKNAQFAKDAADASRVAIQESLNAANAAGGAQQNAIDAANLAAAAAGEAGVSAEEAAKARAAADRAKNAANRADAAVRKVASLAAQATAAANEASAAAAAAIINANNAAAAADQAAAAAGQADLNAQRATTAANNAISAANAATAAVTLAKNTAAQARSVDSERLATEREYGIAQAAAAKEVEAIRLSTEKTSKDQAKTDAATTQQLLTQLTAPGANIASLMPAARKAILGLAKIGGSWVKAGAEAALTGDDAGIVAYIKTGRQVALEQDQFDEAMTYAYKAPLAITIAAQEALDSGEEAVAEFVTTTRYQLEAGEMRVRATYLLDTGGQHVRAAASNALDSADPNAVRIFLEEQYQAQKDLDDRIAATYVLDTGGPEARVAAEVALEGPVSAMRYFIKSRLKEATARDLETKSHVAAIDANISKAAKYAFQAQADAYEAARVAAVARQASADANNYAAQAATYKNNAAASAATAVTQANQAKDSAAQAEQSLATARQAAEQARADAKTAQAHAADAATSASNAAAAAATASQAAANAQQSAVNAGKDAEAAAAAATEAVTIATNLQREEDAAANMAKAAANTTGDVSPDELAAAEAAGGPEAAEELRKAHETLAEGDITDFIIKEGGQLLLDFFGVTDIINCFTKGDIGACGMALIGVLPIGKLFKAAEAIALVGRILPKAAAFFTRHQDAIKAIEKNANNPAVCSVGGAGRVSALSGASTLVVTAGVYRKNPTGTSQPLMQRASAHSCGFDNLNPAFATPPKGASLIGRWGEHAVEQLLGVSLSGKTGVKINGMSRMRFPDHMEQIGGKLTGNVIEVKNVKQFRMTSQIRDFLKYADYGDATKPAKGTLIVYTRASTKGTGDIADTSKEVRDLIAAGKIKFLPFPDTIH